MELVAVDDEGAKKLLSLMRGDMWKDLDQVPRQRTENMVISSIREGHLRNGMLGAGSLGTWGRRLGRRFEDRDGLISVITDRLQQDWYTQNYVAKYFFTLIPRLASEATEEQREGLLEGIAYAAVGNNSRGMRSAIKKRASGWPEEEREALIEALEARRYSDEDFVNEAIEKLEA